MVKEINCVVCDKPAKIVLENFKGYKEGEDYNIYYCALCNTSFVWPQAVDKKIYEEIYSQMNIVPGYNRYASYANEIKTKNDPLKYLADKESMYHAVKEILSDVNDTSMKILEVGSGLGYLTHAIARKGFDIVGIDISSDAVNKAEKQFGTHYICNDVNQYADNNRGNFDMVILTEVLEHIPDPINFFNKLLILLRPKGKIIITTPNKSAYSHDEYWNTELPPVHLAWFSEDSFKAIAKQRCLTLSFFDFTDFNKKHFDITKFKYFEKYNKLNKRISTLSEDGHVITPQPLTYTKKIDRFKSRSLKFVKHIFEPLVISFLTDKKNKNRNNILCVILEKKT